MRRGKEGAKESGWVQEGEDYEKYESDARERETFTTKV